MLKLYKRVEQDLHYWETWDENSRTGIVHWGVVGQRGQDKEVKSKAGLSFRKQIQAEVDQMLLAGYHQIDEEEHSILLIEFPVDGMGTAQDLEKRAALEERMSETLGWTGLGHCDGGSMGSGTMEVCCFVVDFDVARSVIEADLKGTPFANYSRIYNER